MTSSDELVARSKKSEPGRRSASGKVKFKHTSSSLSKFAFDRDQTWVNRVSNNEIVFVDQTGASRKEDTRRAQNARQWRIDGESKSSGVPESDNILHNESTSQVGVPLVVSNSVLSNSSSGFRGPSAQPPEYDLSRSSSFSHGLRQLSDLRLNGPLERPKAQSSSSYSELRFSGSPGTSAEHSSPHSGFGYNIPFGDQSRRTSWFPSVGGSIGSGDTAPSMVTTYSNLHTWASQFGTLESACIMRVNLDLLSQWADSGHSLRHFGTTVPELARSFPPLQNACFTVGATHLLSTPAYKTSRGVVSYQGIPLPALTREAVIRCHDACVADLLKYCNEDSREYDLHVLAALTMLRYHEELLSIAGQDEDRLQLIRIFDTFSTARNLYDAPHTISSSESGKDEKQLAHFRSLRYSILRLALRQDLTAAYPAQTPIKMSLEPFLPLDLIQQDHVDESIWADRCLLQCAKVTNFCHNRVQGNVDSEWAALKRTEEMLQKTCPESFSPLLWQSNSRKTFPLIWYDSVTAVVGIQWLGLSKLLLAVHNPSLPRTGSNVQLTDEVRGIVRTICGIADSNPTIQPAHVHAQMAIMAGASYFVDQREQDAMLAILAHLEYEFGWPTSADAAKLRSWWQRSSAIR